MFAGRLTAGKGVDLLLEAVERSGVAVDLVGDGDLRDMVLATARRHPHLVKLIAPVDYASGFAALLDGYAALIVPTVSDEQPRVIFDAFARGLAVIASATTGNRQIVAHDRTGLLFEPQDTDTLIAALVQARDNPDRLTTMGGAAREEMEGRTHAAMHAERAAKITQALSRG